MSKYIVLNRDYHKDTTKNTRLEEYLTTFNITEDIRYKIEGLSQHDYCYFEDMFEYNWEDIINPESHIFHLKDMTPHEHTEEYINRLWACIERLTPKQKQIIRGLLEGKTQQQVANEMGITQSAISLSLHGAWNEKYQKYHGGIFKKLKWLMEEEE